MTEPAGAKFCDTAEDLVHLMFKKGMVILQIDTAIDIALSIGYTLCSQRSTSVSYLAWEPRNGSSGPWERAKPWTSYCVMLGIACLTFFAPDGSLLLSAQMLSGSSLSEQVCSALAVTSTWKT